METILAGNYEFLCYQNVSIYKTAWRSVNTITRVLNHTSLERAEHQFSDMVCGVYITILVVELSVKMCNTGNMLG